MGGRGAGLLLREMSGKARPHSGTGDGPEAGRLESVRARARDVPARLTAARSRHASVDASFDLLERDRGLAASVLAGGIAFRLFLWLLPLALLLGGVLGFTSSDSSQDIAQKLGLTATAADAVGQAVQEAGAGRWALLLIGVSALLWTSSRSVLAVRRVYALVWGVPPSRAGNPFKEAVAFSGACLLLLAIPAGAARLRDVAAGPGIVAALLAPAGFFGIWLWISAFLPHRDAPLRALVPGAVLAALAMQVIHVFAAFYIAAKLERASALYGGLGLAATLLFILYVVGRVVVSSAVLNAELWRRGWPAIHSKPNSPG
jgi:uncharacterized BrkB/YihY/UPF0761 family membrane protein